MFLVVWRPRAFFREASSCWVGDFLRASLDCERGSEFGGASLGSNDWGAAVSELGVAPTTAQSAKTAKPNLDERDSQGLFRKGPIPKPWQEYSQPHSEECSRRV